MRRLLGELSCPILDPHAQPQCVHPCVRVGVTLIWGSAPPTRGTQGERGDGLELMALEVERSPPRFPVSPGQEGLKTHVRQPKLQQGLGLRMVCFPGVVTVLALAVCRHFLPSLAR